MLHHKKKRKVPRIRLSSVQKIVTLNISTVIFFALFIYIAVSFFLYLTADHISSYRVTAAPLSQNPTFTAMVLRDEEIVTANESGYVNYYIPESAKVKKGGAVLSITAAPTAEIQKNLSENALSKLRSLAEKFSNSYNPDNFDDIYSFKYALEANLLQMSQKPEDVGGALCQAPQEGLVVYSMDGYEGYMADTVSEDCFSQRGYNRVNLKTEGSVNAGEPLYKLVKSEAWSILIPLTDRQTVALAANTYMRVKFLKDGSTQNGKFTIMQIGNQRVGKLTFSNGMIRYAGDRFLEIELVTNTASGLKIPLSAVVSKDFFVIPEGYLTKDTSKNASGLIREARDEKGNVSVEFIEVTVFQDDTDSSVYYADQSLLRKGDILLSTDSSARYTIQESAAFEGVYCINKGYAVFRRISIIDQNDEYCIGKPGLSLGISQFDQIVLDSSTVNEKEILY